MNTPYYTAEPGKVTIEDLAAMVARNFVSMENQLDTRFEGLENRFDKLEVKVDNLEVRFDKLETKVDNLEIRFDKLETKVDGINDRLDQVTNLHAKRLDLVEGRMNTIKKTVERGFETAIAW